MRRPALRIVIALAASFLVSAALAIGCSDDNGTPGTINPSGVDATADRRATGSTGDPKTDDDDSVGDDDDDVTPPPKDAGAKDAVADAKKPAERDANGPGGEGGTCSFNYDCQLALRCECDGECACAKGTRGVGKAGGGCEDGNDCKSAVCLEGPNDELLCSDECKTAGDCPALLPLCQDVAFVGKICTRTPPP